MKGSKRTVLAQGGQGAAHDFAQHGGGFGRGLCRGGKGEGDVRSQSPRRAGHTRSKKCESEKKESIDGRAGGAHTRNPKRPGRVPRVSPLHTFTRGEALHAGPSHAPLLSVSISHPVRQAHHHHCPLFFVFTIWRSTPHPPPPRSTWPSWPPSGPLGPATACVPMTMGGTGASAGKGERARTCRLSSKHTPRRRSLCFSHALFPLSLSSVPTAPRSCAACTAT